MENNNNEEVVEANNSQGDFVFIVEDDKFLRDLLVRKLESRGFKVDVAVTGKEAYGKIKETKPSIVLLDLVLPEGSGFDILEQLKRDAEVKDIPVIILSNLGQKEEVEKGLSLGAEDYMIKAHFTSDEIIKKIKDII